MEWHLKDIIMLGSTLAGVVGSAVGLYIKIMVKLEVLQHDVDNLALMMGTKRAIAENQEKKEKPNG